MYNMNSGYAGFSMSRRAVEAYENGEKPMSKWTKKAILEAIDEYSKDNEVECPLELFKKISAPVLKDLLLVYSSWHHTSSYANYTAFYSIDFDKLAMLSHEDIMAACKKGKEFVAIQNKYKGCIEYLEWTGGRTSTSEKMFA